MYHQFVSFEHMLAQYFLTIIIDREGKIRRKKKKKKEKSETKKGIVLIIVELVVHSCKG